MNYFLRNDNLELRFVTQMGLHNGIFIMMHMSIEKENLPLQLSFMLQLILHSILVAFILCIVGQVMFKLSQYVERKGTNLNAEEEK